ncbi:hypothetical protein ACFL45_05565 [Candidatus Neomarinimicrobiota bacterium]
MLLPLLITGLVVVSCGLFTQDAPDDDDLALYLLLPDTLNAIEAADLPLDSLILTNEPIISLDEIKIYDWSDHSFSIKQAAYDRLKSLEDAGVSTHGLPFVLVVDDERIYLGAFWPLYSSLIPLFPYIEVAPLRLEIQQWHDSDPDPRYDPRIRDMLDAAGVLRE